MKTSFDIESILFKLLNNSNVKNTIDGGIYNQDDRPDDSTSEDVLINTITLTQDFLPQIATSNVNIYVCDKNKRINGKEQLKPDKTRLNALTKMVMEVLRSARIMGLKIIPESKTMLAEPSVKQHYVNIRISWNIQTD